MGNNQSNTNKNYKTFKTISKTDPEQALESVLKLKAEHLNKYPDLSLDEVFWFNQEKEARENIIFILDDRKEEWRGVICPNRSPFNEYEVGDYVKISGGWGDWKRKDIKDSDDMKLAGKVDLEGNVRNSHGTLLSAIEAADYFLGEINAANQRYADMAESARYQNQVLQFQTSWDMPPR